MNKLTDKQLAYLAGLMDGEGCISITKHQGIHSRTPSYIMRVIIAQANESYLRYWHELTGIGSINQKPLNPTCYDWRITSQEALAFLKELYPFLILKKDEADIAIKFQESFSVDKRGGRNYIVPKEVIEKREQLRIALHAKKGASGRRGRKIVLHAFDKNN